MIPLGSPQMQACIQPLRFGLLGVTSCSTLLPVATVSLSLIYLIKLHYTILNKKIWRSIQFVVCLKTVKLAFCFTDKIYGIMHAGALLTFSKQQNTTNSRTSRMRRMATTPPTTMPTMAPTDSSGGAPTAMTLAIVKQNGSLTVFKQTTN